MNLAIIGAGIMGQYSAKALAGRAAITLYDPNKGKDEIREQLRGIDAVIAGDSKDAVRNADVVLFCVPTHLAYDVMQEILPYCRKGALISGQTSNKLPEAKAFDDYMAKNHSSGLEMVTIHTMCNPAKSNPENEILAVIRHKAKPETYDFALSFYRCMSRKISEFETVREHDTMTARTQVSPSHLFLSIASTYAAGTGFPWIDADFGHGLEIMKLSLGLRAASLPSHVYREIQMGNTLGRKITEAAAAVERDLIGMAASGKKSQYRDMVMKARGRLMGSGMPPLLTDETIMLFNRNGVMRPNSHSTLIQYAVSLAESGAGLLDSMKATTPMHTALVCMIEYLLRNDDLLEEAIAIPFEFPKVMSMDFAFHEHFRDWEKAIMLGDRDAYDAKHSKMSKGLSMMGNSSLLELSTEVVSRCRRDAESALDSKL